MADLSKWSAERRRAYNYARNHSAAGLKRRQKYDASEKGRATAARRLWLGHEYAGQASSPAQAQVIQAHIRQRRRQFSEGQRCSAETVGKNKS